MWELIPKLIPQLGASAPAVPSQVAHRWFFITEDSRKCYSLRECCRDERGRKDQVVSGAMRTGMRRGTEGHESIEGSIDQIYGDGKHGKEEEEEGGRILE